MRCLSVIATTATTLAALLLLVNPSSTPEVRVATVQAHSYRPRSIEAEAPLARPPQPRHASPASLPPAATVASPPPASLLPPSPRPLGSSSPASGVCAHALDLAKCTAWASAEAALRLPQRVDPPQRARQCVADCHGRGVCNEETGVCACRAGYNGSACESLNLRLCNGGKTDGLWHGSHCAGECDELTGFCWCPGRLRVRPMSESCQPVRMTLDAYAALGLYTDIWEGTSADGKQVLDPCPAKDRAKQERRKAELDARVRELEHDPAQRAAVLARFWFRSEGGGANVTVGATGVPHASLPRARRGRSAPPPRSAAPELYYKKPTARGSALGDHGPEAWCAASGAPRAKCGCPYDGTHGAQCEERHEAFCLNQCSGHGTCDPLGGFCHCHRGFFGADCSLTSARGADGARVVALHAAHAAVTAPRAPRVYVYELPRMTTLILQYRANGGMCSHRKFDSGNRTQFNGGWVYTSDVALHEWLLRSAHRVADGRLADYFYVPLYLSCTMNPVYDYVGPAPYSPPGYQGIPPRPVYAMRVALAALAQIRAEQPYWNASGGADHLFLFSHDEGACWAPAEIAERAMILTHWGRMDARPTSSSRYPQDNWMMAWSTPYRAPWGERWDFDLGKRGDRFRGSRALIGEHACYDPRKDLVLPVFATPDKFGASPWLKGRPAAAVDAARPTLAYFSGNLAEHEPKKYSRGVRHRLRAAFRGKPGWMLVGNRGPRYSSDLASSQFCIVPPGGDGWSSRADDAVRHGCIPVIVMDNVHMPFESTLDYAAFSLRVPERQVEELDAILRAVPAERQRAMREAMRAVWTRFTYAGSLVDDGFLPASRPGLSRGFLGEHPVPALKKVVSKAVGGDGVAPDAFDTLMAWLSGQHAETEIRRVRLAVGAPG